VQPRSYCEQTIEALRARRAPWFLGVQETSVVDLLSEYTEQELSGFEFEWRLRRATIAAERAGDPALASAARSILRHWQRQASIYI
jgi:hypothetical protein